MKCILSSAIEYKKGDVDAAVSAGLEAVAIRDTIGYFEPPPFPPTTCLGQIYLDQGLYQEALDMFEHEFVHYYDNAFGLRGMIDALKGLDAEQSVIDEYESRYTT